MIKFKYIIGFLYSTCLFHFSCQKEPLFYRYESQDSKISNNSIFKQDTFFVNKQSAINISNQFRNRKKAEKQGSRPIELGSSKIVSIEYVKDKNQQIAFYIISYHPAGFVVISADKRTPKILAFSFEKIINPIKDSFNPGLLWWINLTKNKIENLREPAFHPENTWGFDENINQLISRNGRLIISGPETVLDIPPLLQTNWGQGEGYNDNCPSMNCPRYINGKPPTGCVATAIAQVMKYHGFPLTYTWDLMPNFQGSSETSRLMRDLGRSLGMDYECDGSGVNGRETTINTFRAFGYQSVMFTRPFDSEREIWSTERIVEQQLNIQKPVVFSGGHRDGWWIFGKWVGHEWVCDGIQIEKWVERVCAPNPPREGGFSCENETKSTYYLHMNWGWDGFGNGYFMIGNFKPDADSFNDDTVLYYGIAP